MAARPCLARCQEQPGFGDHRAPFAAREPGRAAENRPRRETARPGPPRPAKNPAKSPGAASQKVISVANTLLG